MTGRQAQRSTLAVPDQWKHPLAVQWNFPRGLRASDQFVSAGWAAQWNFPRPSGFPLWHTGSPLVTGTQGVLERFVGLRLHMPCLMSRLCDEARCADFSLTTLTIYK